MVVSIGMLTSYHNLKKWTQMNGEVLSETDGPKLNQNSYNGSFTYFDRLGFQVQM